MISVGQAFESRSAGFWLGDYMWFQSDAVSWPEASSQGHLRRAPEWWPASFRANNPQDCKVEATCLS